MLTLSRQILAAWVVVFSFHDLRGVSAAEKSHDQQLRSARMRIVVPAFDFKGNTAFTREQLAAVVSPWTNRPIGNDDLEDARRALTLQYVNKGYINSGAVLDDQYATNGVVTFTIKEGELSEIHVSGNKRLRSSFLRNRVKLKAGPPLNINEVQQALWAIKENPNIKRINAELRPGSIPATSLLEVKVEERSPWRFGLQARNDRPPSVGAEVLEALGSHSNVTGNGDVLEVRYGLIEREQDGVEFSGLDNLGGSYTLPLTARETTLHLFYNQTDYAIIEESFKDLEINSESVSYGLTLRHPLWKTSTREISLGVTGDRRESRTFLLGEPFSFSAGAVDGESKVTGLRFFQEWVERSQRQVLALRSTFSFGLDLFEATDAGGDRDAKYVTWLGQGQYVRRLWRTDNQLLLTSSFQWANDPLLSLEQFSIGGAKTVRGYRENQLIRDMGLVTSAELRLPVWNNRGGEHILQLAPFFDYGVGWNVATATPPGSTLTSAGLGLIFTPHDKIEGRVYWGHAFKHIDDSDDQDDLQDFGIHFALSVNIF